jgi:3-deoxy-manno-octulosonate cytidylyltransferase (CMP-KDO synthetase)
MEAQDFAAPPFGTYYSDAPPSAGSATRPLKSVIVIPARLASTRLARKMLLSETGKPLIQHTFESARQAKLPASLVVATDSDEIAAAVQTFGGQAEMTSPECASGTDRVAAVARKMPDVDIFVNVQGDEPEISARAIDLAVELLLNNRSAVMSTVAAPIRLKEKLHDPACVKVVFDEEGRALYFSRSQIPFARTWDDSLLERQPPVFFQHMGLYAYRRDFLLRLANLPPSPTEKLESLEQLRVLHAGFDIHVGVVETASAGIDTPEDYRQFVARWQRTAARGGC